MKPPVQHWVYKAKYDHAHDGDTVTLYLDRGINEYILIPIRLLNCYAPELHGADAVRGKAAADFTKAWMARHNVGEWPFIARTYKPDPREKYGRWLATVWAVDDGACLNEEIIAAGHATVTP